MLKRVNNIFVIIILSLLLRFMILILLPFPTDDTKLLSYYPDENVYYSISQIIKQQGLLAVLLDEHSLWVAPFNSWYIYLLSGITSQPVLFIRIANIILSSITIYLVYKVSLLLFKEKKVALISALLLSVYFPLIELSPTLLTEPIYIFLFVLSMYFIRLADLNEHTNKYYIYAGITLAFACLTRSILLLSPLLLVAYALVFNRQKIKKIILLSVVFYLFISPVMIKNWLAFDTLTISNGSGAALYLGSRPDTEGDDPPYRGKGYNTEQITLPFNHLQTEGDARLRSKAIENIKSQPFDYAIWNVKKIGRLLVGNQYYWFFPFDNVLTFWQKEGAIKSIVKLGSLLIALFVTVFGLGHLLYLHIKQKYMNSTVTMLYYHILISLPFLAIHRYGLPVFCLLTIFAVAYKFNGSRVTDQ